MTAYSNPGNFANLVLVGSSKLAASVPLDAGTDSFSELLSGIVVNQNAVPADNTDYFSVSNSWTHQEFILPKNFPHGENGRIPDLTGFHVLVGVDNGAAATASLDFKLDYYLPATGWTQLVTGTKIGAHTDGDQVWFEVYFKPIEMEALWQYAWRFGIRSAGGVNRVWYSVPNPLALDFCNATGPDGVNALTDGGNDVSLCFRILAATPATGKDFLGNNYRTVATRTTIDNVDPTLVDQFWLSKPNPSKFAVESLYFDLSDDGEGVVVDHVKLDPLTPGVFFNVYFSNDSAPGTTPETWDNLLWERVPKVFQATRADTYALPRPIKAKYIKLEFSHLQARYYAPGDFQKPIQYKKYPKWVGDYFFALTEYTEAYDTQTAVTYDALDLAYSYYADDIVQGISPISPDATTNTALADFFARQENDLSSQVDPETLLKIRVAFQPFLSRPVNNGKFGSLLKDYYIGPSDLTTSYATETLQHQVAQSISTGALDPTNLIIEKNFPVMFFYLTSRHGYRVAQARFEQDRAYFVGVKSVAFMRDHYDAGYDDRLYIESAGDRVNVERSDFELVESTWVTYSTS